MNISESTVPDTYIGKTNNNNMVYLITGFTMLPLHRNNGMEPKRRLAYADFYRMQIVAKQKLSRGQNRRVSRVSRNNTLTSLSPVLRS